MPTLPTGPIYGHYCHKNEHVYSVHYGSAQTVLKTPLPHEALPINSSHDRVPRFRQLRYISLEFPYLLWIPKHNPFRVRGLEPLSYPRHRLPIIKYPEGWGLEENLSNVWKTLESNLRSVGKAMMELGPQSKWRSIIVSPWFFPGRFKFMGKFKTEGAARLAAWYSIDNFLPLIGYVAFGLWCMATWDVEEAEQGRPEPDWRTKVLEASGVDPAVLDMFTEGLGEWERTDRVGGLYHVQNLWDLTPDEREKHAEFARLLARVLHSTFPIPLYLYWGQRPEEFMPSESQSWAAPFRHILPTSTQLLEFATKGSGTFNFVEHTPTAGIG
ncbi:hypothetical protein C8F04DRAFT_1253834 [Mycena alexandri]|uniref:Uncharacterized protein n=1 Tax=Mycena alexandri TaxID=1745969 RepID=A0AAD6T673_9AGAR|nr:hypothetical protein C8F04DRAFT_1253834 [Mycena alexandri]